MTGSLSGSGRGAVSAPKSRCPDCRELTGECVCPEDDGLYLIGEGGDYRGAEGLDVLRVAAEGGRDGA
jgi:hypothetical protein